MSASLVGSEMCIRDRTGDPARSGLEGRQSGSEPQALLARAAELRYSSWPCLLYTSDAADDM
eukprot:5435542-Alexandrium_andersonii.AAC.1